VTVLDLSPLEVSPEADQGEFESRRLWAEVTKAIRAEDQEAATAEKTKLEDRQRAEAKERKEKDETWVPRFFALADPEDKQSWSFKGLRLEPYVEGEPFVPLRGEDDKGRQ
jgi:hypothetical protein